MPQRVEALPAAPAAAAAITRAASRQSYLTIRWLADRAYRADAFALYAYFRWLDDTVDERLADQRQRLDFVARQRTVLAQVVAGAPPADVSPEEALLVGLVRSAPASARRGGPTVGGPDGRSAGLLLCLHSMLDVMDFDARRRGRPVTQDELDDYTGRLAIAVTEALHHCIGHGRCTPHDETRYVAVAGAHVTHMLRDLAEDLDAGYLNIPSEVLAGRPVSFRDLHTPELRDWVRDRVGLARSSFATGRRCLAQTESPRCRLAGHAYIARFEWVLDAIERDGYRLRRSYPERATWRGGLTIAADGARSALAATRAGSPAAPGPRSAHESRSVRRPASRKAR
ncbi:MAG: squalene/phytoene synthase family protein [Actinobacteria bacterium]|nr:squalene/phytoene synthase family protein [Actinomycetota bacterium]MCG2800914.1 squalene/phytoene synthase family protein [Cellulomonas sp.]